MKSLFNLDRFAFVDDDGLIYTSLGTFNEIEDYAFDYKTLSGPDVSIKNLDTAEKKAVIAVPIRDRELYLEGKQLVVCLMEIDMKVMLQGVSIESQSSDATFCNIYTSEGIALSNTVLGGLAVEDLETLIKA